MTQLRASKTGDIERITRSVALLREARSLLVEADAGLAAAKVRRAIKSAEGAQRHAERIAGRAAPTEDLTMTTETTSVLAVPRHDPEAATAPTYETGPQARPRSERATR
jgi:hypothetical protein